MDARSPITLVAAGHRSSADALHDHDAVWATREDGTFHHSSLAVLRQDPDGTFRVERYDSTARFMVWGDALLSGALRVLLPRQAVWTLPATDVDGRGAIIRHIYRHVDLDELVAAARLVDDSRFGLVGVVVNRPRDEVARLLVRAEQVRAVQLDWGDLEEELSWDLATLAPRRLSVVG
jgi:hypothetical protein